MYQREPLGCCHFVHKRILAGVGGFFTGGPAGAIAGVISGGGGGPSTGQTPNIPGKGQTFQPTTCQSGFQWNASTGQCEQIGAAGTAARFFPGGSTGVQAAGFGAAVIGAFGIAALEPAVVGSITRANGTTGPILRCPRGAVLGTDDLCYNKGIKGLYAFRKWKPGTRPFLTGGEVKILRRAATIRSGKSSKRLLKSLGMGG